MSRKMTIKKLSSWHSSNFLIPISLQQNQCLCKEFSSFYLFLFFTNAIDSARWFLCRKVAEGDNNVLQNQFSLLQMWITNGKIKMVSRLKVTVPLFSCPWIIIPSSWIIYSFHYHFSSSSFRHDHIHNSQ